jgi:hypothetical protein
VRVCVPLALSGTTSKSLERARPGRREYGFTTVAGRSGCTLLLGHSLFELSPLLPPARAVYFNPIQIKLVLNMPHFMLAEPNRT